jgi:hypothetical protein
MLACLLSNISPLCMLLCQLLHMPAANSIISISLYDYSLVQSFVLACYMPALYANISMSGSTH